MRKWLIQPDFSVERDLERCIQCQVCVRQCANDVHSYNAEDDTVVSDSSGCVGCHRCATLCPAGAIKIRLSELEFRPNAWWNAPVIRRIYRQAESGGILLSGMGSDQYFRNYWDRMLLNASQVTNPSIDPLREPMELKTFLGGKPDKVEWKEASDKFSISAEIGPQLELRLPIMFSAMSYGSISLNASVALARAAAAEGTFANSGEGGLHKSIYPYAENMIVQVASGRFGVNVEYMNPGEKVDASISETRMIPIGSDAISPAPHHDIYSIEDLKQLIFAIKEVVNYSKPVCVKIAAVHNIAAIASGCVRAGADIVAIDGFRGGPRS